jgi:hypothetical protein
VGGNGIPRQKRRGNATCSQNSGRSSQGRRASWRALVQALPEESREELDRLAQEDRRLAKEGLVELMDEEGEIYHKHIDELAPWDVADRLRADTARSDRLAMRTSERIERREARRLLGRGRRQVRRLPISRRELEVLKGAWPAVSPTIS